MTLSTATFDGTGDNVGAVNERRCSSVVVGTAGFGGSPLSSACKNDGIGADSAGFTPAVIGSVGNDTVADGADSAGGKIFPVGIFPPRDGNMFGRNGKLTTDGIRVGSNVGAGVGFGEASSAEMPPPPLVAGCLLTLALSAVLLMTLLLLSTPLLFETLVLLMLLLLLLLLVKAQRSKALTGA